MGDSQRRLSLDSIRTDGGTQPRAELSDERIAEYREAMAGGATFPPIVVYHDGDTYWLADGFHRFHAATLHGTKRIAVEVRQGTQRDAILYSVGANATHGQPRSNADKRRAVLRLLHDEEWAQWSDREIARRCAVTHPFVSSVRLELSGNGYQMGSTNGSAPARKAKRGKTTYTQRQRTTTPTRDTHTPEKPADDPEEEDEERFDVDIAVTRMMHAMSSAVANWPDDVSMQPLIAAMESYLQHIKGRVQRG